jgi:hypothetical protein
MQALDAALRFDAKRDFADLLARSAPDAKAGAWEKYKTATEFDGTAQHPWWLDTASLQRS